jgi:hypothetical protein
LRNELINKGWGFASAPFPFLFFPIHITLVQIGFLKTSYFGQHNEGGPLINPIMPLNTVSLGLLRAFK